MSSCVCAYVLWCVRVCYGVVLRGRVCPFVLYVYNACMLVCVRACVRAFVRACVCVCFCVYLCACVHVSACVCLFDYC